MLLFLLSEAKEIEAVHIYIHTHTYTRIFPSRRNKQRIFCSCNTADIMLWQYGVYSEYTVFSGKPEKVM